MNDSFHSGKADPELVLKQLANGSYSSVAKMVDIVNSSDAVTKVKEIRNCCDYVVNCDMLRNKLVDSGLYSLHKLFLAVALIKDLSEHREGYLFVNSKALGIEIYKVCDIYHVASDDLDLVLFKPYLSLSCGRGNKLLYLHSYEDLTHACSLYFCSLIEIHKLSCLGKYLACERIDYRLGQPVSGKS